MKRDFTNTIVYNLMNTRIGNFIFSFLCGLGISVLFKKVCKDNCIQYFAPHPTEFIGKIFRIEDQCFEYEPYVVECTDKENILLPYKETDLPINKI